MLSFSVSLWHVPARTCWHAVEETVHILSWMSQWSVLLEVGGLISVVGWQHSVGTHPLEHSWEPAAVFKYINLEKNSKLSSNHLTNSEFKVTFSTFAGHFTENVWDCRWYSCDSKGNVSLFCFGWVFFVQDMLDSPHLPDDSCDTLGPFCSWLPSVNLACWFWTSYVAILK